MYRNREMCGKMSLTAIDSWPRPRLEYATSDGTPIINVIGTVEEVQRASVPLLHYLLLPHFKC